jgi:heme a synthase
MLQPTTNPWLHRFAVLTALATLGLVAIGGLVTSHGVGLAVPDWPNTYGYNMFVFPFSKWVGGILYEHSHRLMAAFVGLLTTVLAVWLWVRETRGRERWLGIGALVLVLALMGVRALPVYLLLAGAAPIAAPFCFFQIHRTPGALRWWGLIAFAAVILQGVLGGLRVVWLKDQIGIVHATLAQLFFALMCAIALFTSRWWQGSSVQGRWSRGAVRAAPKRSTLDARRSTLLSRFLFITTLLILAQLILGATMRHQHAGLAIPDFPLAYGKVWPAMDDASVARYNQQRLETVAFNPITGLQIGLQMAHRILALLILVGVASCAATIWRQLGPGSPLSKLALSWLALILLQAFFGAATILSNKAADIATVHVVAGALALALGTVVCMVCARGLVFAHDIVPAEALPLSLFGAQRSAGPSLK